MTDREFLEFAAKAAGKTKARYVEVWGAMADPAEDGDGFDYLTYWNPLTDDGAALRLAVEFLFEIDMGRGCIAIRHSTGMKILEAFNGDPLAATRRAIVRAAAEIGKGMK